MSEKKCTGCDTSEGACDEWKSQGKMACCPECKHPEPTPEAAGSEVKPTNCRQITWEEDLTPEEAQLEVVKRFGNGSSVQVEFEINSDWTWTKRVTLFNWENDVVAEADSFRKAFLEADPEPKP